MENEKLLPPGEPEAQVTLEGGMRIHRKPVEPAPEIFIPAEVPPLDRSRAPLPGIPSPKQQQWGVVISIVIIVLMITIGAFYAWGQRIAQDRMLTAPSSAQ